MIVAPLLLAKTSRVVGDGGILDVQARLDHIVLEIWFEMRNAHEVSPRIVDVDQVVIRHSHEGGNPAFAGMTERKPN